MTCQKRSDGLPTNRQIARVVHEPKNKERVEIRYLENDRSNGWDAYVCKEECCCLALDQKGEVSDQEAIAYASMILDEIGIKNIPYLRPERDDRHVYAIAPPWSRANPHELEG